MKREERIKQLKFRIAMGILTATVLGTCGVVLGSTYQTIKTIDEVLAEPIPEETRYIYIMEEIAPVQYDTLVPAECIPYVNEVCARYAISPELVLAIIEAELGGNPDAVSSSNCIGLMQVKPKFAAERMDKLGVTNLFDPYSNILVGMDILSDLAARYHDVPAVLMAYNEGESGIG